MQVVPDRKNRAAPAWPAWLAGGFAAILLLAGLALWARSGVEIYFTMLLNGLATCF
jgi:hypothetical protein